MNMSDSTSKFGLRQILLYIGIGLIVFVVGSVVIFGRSDKPAPTNVPIFNTSNPTPNVQAQKELDDLMALSKKALIVDSYQFTAEGGTVYVSALWSASDIAFKNDFLAKVGGFKKSATGNPQFDVRSSSGKELLAEVRESGSAIIYK